ncbi:putative O-acetyltransferase CAS1 [Hyphodiscus hymeniophilus]|uniref:O-acetyltransferase CAS1 n=1 Tax=Hyphodiscus hymeniophilus TaxID=353542 RepID=A0A9P7AZZ6_9HELO|nr:putative O-acetyltransferase CAS1 [Hyphodiscus hymeniophilus]
MQRPTIPMPSSSNRETNVVERIFQALLAVVVFGVVYRYCWQDISDPYKCGALLNKGQWLDPGPRWSSRTPFQNWQPPGCIMHEYKKEDIQECFGKRRIVFIGDSTTRQVFWAVAKKMDQARAEGEITEMLDMDEKHHDLDFTSAGVTVQFIWDPFLNSTGLKRELKDFRPDSQLHSNEADESAGLILLGAPGLWYARHGQQNLQKDFRDSIETVIPFMDHAIQGNTRLPAARPFPFREYSPNFLLLAPVQVPWYESLSPSRAETMTPEKIDQMNDYLQQVSAHSSADVIWSYTLMTHVGRSQYEESGIHVVDNVAHRKADVLLNLRCNADAASKGYPFDRTCCSNYKQPGTAQWVILLGGMLILPTLPFLRRQHLLRLNRFLPSPSVLSALVVSGLVVSYCFYADRTQIFEKEQKQFRQREVIVAYLEVAVAGLLSIRECKSLKTNYKTAPKVKDHGFLTRDQSDEWKGWMQLVLLIYHYTHGSNILWIYQIVRLLVASYLFMTGFGHTLYFLRREDYSLRRVATVLVRLNLLSCMLPYMMRTDVVFYYFAPLVSFWFLVIYCTLKIGHTRNSNLHYLFGKIVLSALLTTAFTMIPGILELGSFFLRLTCAISWNVGEIRFRIFLDMYIVYIGMFFAALHYRATRLHSGAATPKRLIDHILKLINTYHRAFKTLTIIASLALLPGFWALTRRSPDKEDYNWWQPFISFIPILSFITLRNSHRLLRNYHSTIFASLGRYSLEICILQYHIWLAGDSTGILRLGLWSRWTETAILTPVFLWVSWRMADATQVLTSWIVDGDRAPTQSLSRGDFAASKESPPILPNVRDGESTPSKDLRFEPGDSRMGRLVGWVIRTARSDLRYRLGLILTVLWLGNVSYS